MASVYKLNYYNTRGHGEAIRFLLAYLEVPFEDNRVSVHDWHQLKRGIPFEKLPTLEKDNKVGYQSLAICRYLGRQVGIAGSDELEAAQIDAVADTLKDLNTKMLDIYLAPDCQIKEKLREELLNETFPYYLSKLDEIVEINGGFFVNGKLSWVDLFFAAGTEAYDIIGQTNVLTSYHNLCKLNDTIRSLPPIQRWLEHRPFSAF